MAFCILFSTYISHSSTYPLAYAVSIKGFISTYSFSAENIPWIFFNSSILSLLIPSKHFIIWGYTRSGSFVSDKISSNSSLDKK